MPRPSFRPAALTLLAAAIFPGCQLLPLLAETGNGELETESRELANFDEVSVESAVATDVSVGASHAVVITCDSNLLEFFETRVEDSALIIGHDDGVTLLPETDCKIAVTMPAVIALSNTGAGSINAEDTLDGLERVDNTGAGSVNVDGASTDGTLAVTNTGAGSVFVGGISAQRCEATNDGAGSITLEGAVEVAQLTNAGVGSIDAGGLSADDFIVDNEGLGSIAVP